MKYLGNYKDWIQDQWITEVLSFDGYEGKIVPTSNENKDRYAEFERGVAAGWSLEKVYWWRYTKDITTFDILNPPWLSENSTTSWWIVKQSPGQVQPMHVDVDKHNNCNRFWIPLQDYEPGHLFVINDTLSVNYKKGDVYQFNSQLDYHGSANIGMSSRLVLLVTEHL
jgi:hypothetical protein